MLKYIDTLMCVVGPLLKKDTIFCYGVLQERKKIENKKSILIYTDTNLIQKDGESIKNISSPVSRVSERGPKKPSLSFSYY